MVKEELRVDITIGKDTLGPAFDRLSSKLKSFNKLLSQAKGIDKFRTRLKTVNLQLKESGKIMARGSAAAISNARAVRMVVNEERRLAMVRSQARAFVAAPKGLDEISRFQKIGEQLGTMRKQGLNVNKQLGEMQKRLRGNIPALRAFSSGLKRGAQSFNMFNLSLLFGGMALQRGGLAILRFMIPSMDKLEKLSTTGAKKVLGMVAAFEFLKISIFETLAQTPLFAKLVEWIIRGMIAISEFAQEHPNVTAMIASLGALAVMLGTGFIIAAGYGQVASVLSGVWATLKELIGVSGTGGTIGRSLGGFKKFITGALPAIIGVAIAIDFAIKAWRILSEDGTTIGEYAGLIAESVIAGALIGFYFGPKGALVGAAIGLFVGLAVTITDIFIENMDFIQNWKNNFAAIFETIRVGAKLSITGELTSQEVENLNNAVEKMSEIEDVSKDISQQQVNDLAKVFTEQIKSVEMTDDMILNTEKFGKTITEVFGGKEGKAGVIGIFKSFGEEILLDDKFFVSLRDKIEAWASIVTVKTVLVRYIYEQGGGGRSAGARGSGGGSETPPTTGNRAEEQTSSVNDVEAQAAAVAALPGGASPLLDLIRQETGGG